MEAYAVIQTGGKQYMVRKGEIIKIEHLEAEKGNAVEFKNVLAFHDGTTIKIGAPVELEGANYRFNGTVTDMKLGST
ncbi:MAG: 50S ribosomal protein L21 [Cyanobacteria bacterium]|nr:50S ribosomal protein L21 [Cyanobacteriota bacterium]